MSNPWLNIAVVAGLVLTGAFFVAAELALVSLRESQVAALAATGTRRARAVAKLAADQTRMLATVQLGVTLTALLSSAFGAVTLSGQLGGWLEGRAVPYAPVLAFLAVTLCITLAALVLGELAPKRVALQRNEQVALATAPTLERLAVASRPVVWLLSVLTDAVVRVCGCDPRAGREAISGEELRGLVAANDTIGENERDLIEEVFDAGQLSVSAVMVPRTDVTFLRSGDTLSGALQAALSSSYSRFPVLGLDVDDVLGFVHLRDLMVAAQASGSGSRKVREVMRPVLTVPSTKSVLDLLGEMRSSGSHLAVVADEYGGTAGIVTLEDLLEELVGQIRDEFDGHESEAVEHSPGVFDLDGLTSIDDAASVTGATLPEGPYETVSGFVAAQLGRLAEVGDVVTVDGVQVQVLAVEGRRVASVRVQLVEPEPACEQGEVAEG